MILWIVLFLLVVGISFVLALQSMKDYQEIPQKSNADYGLFLIRQPENFNTSFLDNVREQMLAENLIISIERLFKDSQSALTIFGPKKILLNYTVQLNFLELEDYAAALSAEDISLWEVGLKTTGNFNPLNLNNIFNDLSQLGGAEQFFWQVVLAAKKDGGNLFQTQIRALVYSKDPERRKTLVSSAQNIASSELTKVPKPFSTQQMLDSFKLRSLSKDSSGPMINSDGVSRLVKI